jgi:hypothetical protein
MPPDIDVSGERLQDLGVQGRETVRLHRHVVKKVTIQILGANIICYKMLGWQACKKRPLGRYTHSWEYTISVTVTIDGVLDWIFDLLTTHTHSSEIQVITTPSLISTLYKSPQHTALVQTGFWAHPPSYPMRMGRCLPRSKAAGA